jgi:hypothetical protein
MLLQLNPRIPLTTPKGPAWAILVIDASDDHDLIWTCIQDETGEIWCWSNKDVRGVKNLTFGRTLTT